MRKFILFVITCLLTLGLHNYAFADDDDDIGDNSAKDDRQIYYIYDDVDLITTLKYQYPQPKTMIKFVYPLLQSEQPSEPVATFNMLVLDLLKIETDDFKKKLSDLTEVQKNLPKSNIKNDLSIDYDSSFINSGDDDHILSIRFTFEGMLSGMAHGYHYHRVLNYDLDEGEAFELADLFLPDTNYLQRLSDYSRKVLQRKLTDKSMIAAGTEPTPENFRNWNLKPMGLVITFEEYQVAPYVFGSQTVIIPYSQLQDIIDPDSVIGSCMKSRARCMRGNLLTGGFMDEA